MVKEVIIKDYEKFAEIVRSDGRVVEVIEEIVKNWIEKGKEVEQLSESLMILLGEEAGRLVYNILTSPPGTVMNILKVCEEIGDQQILLILKRLAALYGSEIRKREVMKVSMGEGTITIEKGESRISLSEEDMRMMIKAIFERNPEIFEEFVPKMEPENKYHV